MVKRFDGPRRTLRVKPIDNQKQQTEKKHEENYHSTNRAYGAVVPCFGIVWSAKDGERLAYR